jgi:hypothetical protein
MGEIPAHDLPRAAVDHADQVGPTRRWTGPHFGHVRLPDLVRLARFHAERTLGRKSLEIEIREASWSRSNFSWGTFRCKRPNATLAASNGFDQLSMIALASSRIPELGACLWKGADHSDRTTVMAGIRQYPSGAGRARRDVWHRLAR